MAIAFDAKSNNGTCGGASPQTWTHTCTGNNRILFVSATTLTNADNVTAVTYNGVSLTKVGAKIGATTGISLWYLVNPASGANTVSVTYSGSPGASLSASYTGAQGSGVPDSFNTGTATVSTTTVADNCWLVGAFFTGNNNAVAGTNTIIRDDNVDGTHQTGGCGGIADSNSAQTPAGAHSLAITGTGEQDMVVASFPPTTSAARFWVGGTGTWDDTSTTHWSATSGGSSGASVPNAITTSVTFDGNSGGGTCTLGANYTGVTIDFTGYTGTFTGSSTLNLSGNLTLASGMTLSYTGAITFSATATGKTITTATKTILSTITFDGVGGGWTLQDALTSTGASITLTNGSLNLNNFNVSVPQFISSNSNVRVLTMGSGTLTLTGTGTVWSLATSTNITLTANTSTIKLTDASSSSKTFGGGGLTYNNLWITGAGTGTYTISGSNTFIDFKADTPPHTINFTAGTTQTLQTFTVNGTAGNLMTLQSTVSGTAWNMVKSNAGIISCDYLSLQDSHVS